MFAIVLFVSTQVHGCDFETWFCFDILHDYIFQV